MEATNGLVMDGKGWDERFAYTYPRKPVMAGFPARAGKLQWLRPL